MGEHEGQIHSCRGSGNECHQDRRLRLPVADCRPGLSAPLRPRFRDPVSSSRTRGAPFRSVLESVGAGSDLFEAGCRRPLRHPRVRNFQSERNLRCRGREGYPPAPAVVWQCKRSAEICERLRSSGMEEEIRERTGLLKTLLFRPRDHLADRARNQRAWRSMRGERSSVRRYAWLAFRLTRGQTYATDHTLTLRAPSSSTSRNSNGTNGSFPNGTSRVCACPRRIPSSHHYGETDFEGRFPAPIPISAMIGDSHAAAFGEMCFTPGTAKATMGTGSSIMMNVGQHRSAIRAPW